MFFDWETIWRLVPKSHEAWWSAFFNWTDEKIVEIVMAENIKYMKTTWKDTNKPDCESKRFEPHTAYSGHGRSSIEFECPWCQETVQAFLWSIRGSGKKCGKCGALFSGAGVGHRMKEVSNEKH